MSLEECKNLSNPEVCVFSPVQLVAIVATGVELQD